MRHAVILILFASTGCLTFVQPHMLDPGRGAAPMTPGKVNVHGGVAGAYPGGGAGFGIEGQVSDDFAVGFDCEDSAVQTAVGLAIPNGTYLTGQLNPSGWDNLAIRGAAGFGVDALPNIKNTPLAPWLGGTLGVVTSTTLGGLEPYLQLNLGVRRYVGGPDALVATVPKIGGVGLIDNTVSAGATAGFKLGLSDSLSFYLSGSIAALVLTPDGTQNDVTPTLLQTSNGQLGISYAFDMQ